jgi:hypothetical protein
MQGIGKSILNNKSLKQFVMDKAIFLVLLMLVIVIAIINPRILRLQVSAGYFDDELDENHHGLGHDVCHPYRWCRPRRWTFGRYGCSCVRLHAADCRLRQAFLP